MEKFKKDIELSGSLFKQSTTESEREGWINDPNDRNWINHYFMMKQLVTIKWTLIIISLLIAVSIFG